MHAPLAARRRSVNVAGIGFAAALAMTLLPCAGCGPRSDRLEINGEVTLDGAPLSGGSIRFTSLDTEKIVASGAMVENGKFQIPQEKGLTPGKYHLEINAPDNDAPPIIVRATPGGPGIPTQPERIPPEYNDNSDKKIEVTADGDNHFVFDIVSRPTKQVAKPLARQGDVRP